MPARDGTGPLGTGPIGWRLGPCVAGLRPGVRPRARTWPPGAEPAGIRPWLPLLFAAAGGLLAAGIISRAGKSRKDASGAGWTDRRTREGAW